MQAIVQIEHITLCNDAPSRRTAQHIHAVHMAAYQQEAHLLGFADARDFPPLQQTVDGILRSSERFIVAVDYGNIVGVISIEPPVAHDDADGAPRWAGEALATEEAHIASLTVMPTHQRRGIARRLLAAAIAAHAGKAITVSTSALNQPALALYAQLGFEPARTKRITWQGLYSHAQHELDLVLLRRA